MNGTLLLWAAVLGIVDAAPRSLLNFPSPPFTAIVTAKLARVQLAPEANSPQIGSIAIGGVLTVTSCEPDCASTDAWALIGTTGAVKLRALAPYAPPIESQAGQTAEALWYGRVGKKGIRIFKAPRLHSPLLSRRRISRELAFLPNIGLQQEGWLERVEGGFVRSKSIQLLLPSPFHGEENPHLPLAFVIRPSPKLGGTLHRYDVLSVQAIDGAHVLTNRGSVARNTLRIVSRQPPPTSIPLGAKWVLVDLSEQTLTAYEGETAVYATLISSGKALRDSRTHVGLFSVEHKFLYSDMHGTPPEAYVVDRVPYTQYYHGNEGLHGTYWHDEFGTPASHGCTNLSLTDARWLFEWAPPLLPDGWQSVEPKAAGLPTLWVVVQRRTKPNFDEAQAAR